MKNTNWPSIIGSGVVVICAVIITALVVRREFFSAPPQRQHEFVTDWRGYAAHGQRMGATRAPVTVVVFSDFQCPACRVLADHLRAIRAEHPERVVVVYRHYPLPNHPFAAAAARASECAGEQGQFEAYHDALFQGQETIGSMLWTHFATSAKVPDLPAFERCVSGRSPVNALDRDVLSARQLGVEVTPTVLINGVRLDGTPPLEVLRRYVQRAKPG